jgi:hypothetical protein
MEDKINFKFDVKDWWMKWIKTKNI